MPEDYSEQEIINGLLKRENEIFKYLENSSFPILLKWIRKNSGDRSNAEDVYHDGIIILLKKLNDPKLIMDSKVSTMQIGICKNLWLRELKRRKKKTISLDPDHSFTIDSETDARMDNKVYRSILDDSFAKLREDCRRILDLYYKGMRLVDIALQLAFSPKYVKKRKTHCNSFLMAQVMNHPDYHRL